MSSTPSMDDAGVLCSAARGLVDQALEKAREITERGAAIDEHQVLTERVVYAATEARAAAELLEFTRSARIQGRGGDELERVCGAAVADLVPGNGPDVVIAAPFASELRIHQQLPGGVLNTTADIVPLTSAPLSVAAGDVDGDGDLDLVVTMFDNAQNFQVLLNDGNGLSYTA